MRTGPAPRPEAVLFDLDGTLADTLPDLADALAGAVRDAGGGRVDEARLRPLVSGGTRRMIASVLAPDADPAQIERVRHRFLARYHAHIAVRTRLFPGIEPVLRTLEGHGVPWGIVTNKHDWLTGPLLESLALHQRAACVVSGDTAAYSKPHPAPVLLACERLSVRPPAAVYVGDARSDIESGRAAGTTTVSAGWGYPDPDDPPRSWGADADTDTPDDLLAWIHRALTER